MSAQTNWAGYTKRRYAGISKPLPEPGTIAAYLPFVGADLRGGAEYELNVQLGIELGQTADVSGGDYSYNASIDSKSLPARVSGGDLSVVGTIPRSMLHKMKSAARVNGDMTGLDSKVAATAAGLDFFRELMLHYGCGTAATVAGNIGVVSAIVSGTNLGAGGPVVCDLTRASWCPTLWTLLSGGLVDVYESDGSTLVESGVTATYVKTAGNNRLSLAKTGSSNDVDATDILVPTGWGTKTAVGIEGILGNTGSLFEISAATYPPWAALPYAVGGALNRAKILAMMAQLGDEGLTNGGVLFASSKAFGDCAEEASDLIRYHQERGETAPVKKSGAKRLVYVTPAGECELQSDPLMKQGTGFFIGREENGKPVGCRAGSTDNTAMAPGDQGIIHRKEGSAGSIVEYYTNQAPFLHKPSWCSLLSGITSTGDGTPSA